MPIETRQLRYFLAVAEELHVGRAAAKLHISQPPLSRQIQQLEERLGAQLFDRAGRRMRLTPAGSALHRDAERITASLEAAERNVRLVAEGLRGTLRIGFVSTVLYGVLPDVVRRFRELCADVRVELEELTAEAQLQAFDERRIDVGFMLCPAGSSGLESVTVLEEPLVLCVPTGHRLASGGDPIDPAELDGEGFVMFPRHLSPGLHDRIVAFTEQAQIALRVGQEAVQMQTLIGLVSAGLGVALVPDCMSALARPGVHYRRLLRAPRDIETCIVYPRAASSALIERFVGLASEARATEAV